jgi:puromycin-sensitive aminopeptidase
LNDVELLSLESDVWAMVQTGASDVGSYLELTEAFLHAPAGRVAADAAMERVRYLSERIVTDDDRARLEAWVRRTLQPVASELGWVPKPDEPLETRQLRAGVIRVLGEVGRDPEILQQARELVLADLAGTRAADPSLASTAYELAASAGDAALYERILQSLPAAGSPTEFYRRQGALARFTDPRLIERTFEYALSGEVRSQDAPGLLSKLLANPAASRQVWRAAKDRWAEVMRKSDISQGALQILRGIQFCDTDAAGDVRQFFSTHPAPGAARAVDGTVERIEVCAATRAAQRDRLARALAQR